MTLAEIVRATGSSRATAHAIVGELVAHDWVVRDESGAFRVGPAFVTLGRTAAAGDHVTDWAAAAMRQLSQSFGISGFVARRTAPDTVTIADHSGDTTHTPWFAPGHHMRLRPPTCREFMAWAPPAEREAWIAQAAAGTRTRLALALDAIRERGYSIERVTNDHAQVVAALDSIDGVSEGLRSRVGDLLAELATIDYLPDEMTGEITAMTVGAPIFDATGDVVAAIVMCPGRSMATTEFTRMAEATRVAAEQISSYLR